MKKVLLLFTFIFFFSGTIYNSVVYPEIYTYCYFPSFEVVTEERCTEQIIRDLIKEICLTFRYGIHSSGTTARNLYIGPNERVGKCVDYTAHWVFEWNRRYLHLGIAYLALHDGRRYLGRYTIDFIQPNCNPRRRDRFVFHNNGNNFEFFSVDGKETYWATKIDDRLFGRYWSNHAWVILVLDSGEIYVVDPQFADDVGIDRGYFKLI